MKSEMSVSRGTRAASCLVVLAAAAVSMIPQAVQAQSGKWVATVGQLSVGGSADVTVDKKSDKQSKARITFRNVRRDMRLSWDIVEGHCRDEGQPIAAQAAFSQVQTQMDGSGTASSNVPKLESGKSYYVRVFDPQSVASDANAYGCASLSEKP